MNTGALVFLIGLNMVLKFSSLKYLLNSANMMLKTHMAHISGTDIIIEESISKLVGRQYCRTSYEILPCVIGMCSML